MTSIERLAKLAAPTGRTAPRRGFRLDIGDGGICPVDPRHGHMYTAMGFTRQWCAHHDHDMDGSRSHWPFEDGFDAAVAEWRAAHPTAVSA
jgi:hypothetical protein